MLRLCNVAISTRAVFDEPHSEITPDGYVDNLAEAVDLLLSNN